MYLEKIKFSCFLNSWANKLVLMLCLSLVLSAMLIFLFLPCSVFLYCYFNKWNCVVFDLFIVIQIVIFTNSF